MSSTLVMLLAGGVGSRLDILAHARAKPAVPFGGIYRIIDFTLSNVMNSGLDNVGVLTQYKPLSLMEHIGTGEPWDFIGRRRGAKILPPRTGQKDSDWYKGTADAVRQNLDFLESRNPRQVLILSGDHIYQMDYSKLIEFHKQRQADLTIGMMRVPWEDTRHFGIAVTDEQGRILEWEEKPDKPRSNLASMGIYVFRADYLLSTLRSHKEHDFGKHIIPAAVAKHKVYAFLFEGYWRDVGTLKAYWEANMDLLDPASGLDLDAWLVRTKIAEEGRLGDRPPAHVAGHDAVRNSLVSPGCVLRGRVEGSILSPGVVVEPGACVLDSVVMHNTVVERGAVVEHAILDKNVRVGADAVLGVGPNVPNREKPDHLSEGLVVVGKGAEIPPACRVGKNCILYPGVVAKDYPSREIESGTTIRPRQGN